MLTKVKDQLASFVSLMIGTYSLVDFKTALDIALLILSIVNLLIILISKIIMYFKNDGKIDKQEFEEIKNDATEIAQKVKEGEEACRKIKKKSN
jgi:hypothetical protein